MKCPSCGADANGAFCSKCGTRLSTKQGCVRCGAALPAGSRFCVQCGARSGETPAWLRYGVPAALAAIALLGGYWLGNRDDTGPGSPPGGTQAPFAANGATGAAGTLPPLTGSMRDQADRLFERIMQARARGDTTEAKFFLPMALQAYQGAGPLDADGLFHLGLLQLEGDQPSDAAATARQIQAADAGHLFGFALAGEAALAANDQAGARTAFSQFLSRFDSEIARGLPEYEMHRPALDEYRTQAAEVTGG